MWLWNTFNSFKILKNDFREWKPGRKWMLTLVSELVLSSSNRLPPPIGGQPTWIGSPEEPRARRPEREARCSWKIFPRFIQDLPFINIFLAMIGRLIAHWYSQVGLRVWPQAMTIRISPNLISNALSSIWQICHHYYPLRLVAVSVIIASSANTYLDVPDSSTHHTPSSAAVAALALAARASEPRPPERLKFSIFKPFKTIQDSILSVEFFDRRSHTICTSLSSIARET